MAEVIVGLVPGQGQATLTDLLRGLDEGEKRKEITEHYLKQADSILGEDLSALIRDQSRIGDIRYDTRLSQIVVYLISNIWRKILQVEGGRKYAKPTIFAAQSAGLIAAATFAGAFDFATGLRVVNERGSRMKRACTLQPGKMSALIKPDFQEINKLLPQFGVNISGINETDQITLSGPISSMEAVIRVIRKRKLAKKIIDLQTQGAFHSQCMREAERLFRKFLATLPIADLKVPILANSQLKIMTTAEELREELGTLTKTVLFEPGIRFLEERLGAKVFIEIGPGEVLSKSLLRRQEKEKGKIRTVLSKARRVWHVYHLLEARRRKKES